MWKIIQYARHYRSTDSERNNSQVVLVSCRSGFYRQQTKLWEGNVFTRVCQFVHMGGDLPPEREGLPSGEGG